MTTSHGDFLGGGTRRPGTSRYPDAAHETTISGDDRLVTVSRR